MVSKAKVAANARYNVKTYDVISFRVQKSENINQRIDDAIQGTNTSKAAFILDAIRAKLDGPQPVQAQPQPDTTTATGPDVIPVNLPASTVNSISKACAAGYGQSCEQYILTAVNTQLRRDAATEKAKRRAPVPYECDDDLPPAIPPEYIR